MKDTYYFPHDYNAKGDPKILELRAEYGWAGYGIYWALLEIMAQDANGVLIASLMGGLSVGLNIDKQKLIEMVAYMVKLGLFTKKGDQIFSKRMQEHKKQRKILSDKGKEGASVRWKNSPPNSQPNSPPNTKERKGKEINIKKDFVENVFIPKRKSMDQFLKEHPE